ncbi:Protein of unknown function [Gryllus bimaculatus]|nr:Protein of unknown function [Gryllus bimaculatus]
MEPARKSGSNAAADPARSPVPRVRATEPGGTGRAGRRAAGGVVRRIACRRSHAQPAPPLARFALAGPGPPAPRSQRRAARGARQPPDASRSRQRPEVIWRQVLVKARQNPPLVLTTILYSCMRLSVNKCQRI